VLSEAIEAGESRYTRITNQASMVGIRSQEELGAGIEAWAQLETGFAPDASGPFATRNSGVGLRGTWGTLLLGRWDSPFEQTQAGIVDPFSDQGLPDITGATLQQGNFARRQQNAIQLWSPAWRSIQAKASYATGETRTAQANAHDLSVSFAYRDDDLYAAIAFEKHFDQAGSATLAGSDETGLGISFSRRFGALKIYGQAGRYRRTGAETERSFMAAFEQGWGAHSLLGTFQQARGGALAGSTQPRCSLAGVGYRYAFSRRTFFIAEAALVDNRTGNTCNFGSNPVAISPGQDLRGAGLGLRVLF